jgi:hypothetical protein
MTNENKTDQPVQAIVLPGTFTDLAKALREAIGALRDMGSLIADGARLIDKRHSKKAARHLSALSFTPDGSRQYLERIASGQGTADDLNSIGVQMAETAGQVEDSIRSLGRFRDRLRETYGMAAALKLDEVIYGPTGKQALRHTLLDIANVQQVEHAQSAAQWALNIIEQLNQQLTELHDMVALPRAER